MLQCVFIQGGAEVLDTVFTLLDLECVEGYSDFPVKGLKAKGNEYQKFRVTLPPQFGT